MPTTDIVMLWPKICAIVLLLLALLHGSNTVQAEEPGPKITDGTLGADDERAWLATSKLVYTSDYFSFVGRDTDGHVAFALDNNRGRDGNDYQAEHAVALHDEQKGWVPVDGTGRYENPARELVAIPDSRFFRFAGHPARGLRIDSPPNGLTLDLAPIAMRVVRHDARTFYALGSAAATLRWNGRTIEGRVIYEDFIRIEFNRMTRPSPSLFNNFNGLYLLTANGDDLYIRSSKATGIPVPEPMLGFLAHQAGSSVLDDLRVAETDHDLAWGFYTWPTSWFATWQTPDGPATLTLNAVSRKGMVNWVIGGYALSIVRGEMHSGGKSVAVYGWGELIR